LRRAGRGPGVADWIEIPRFFGQAWDQDRMSPGEDAGVDLKLDRPD
jgi:hypothetical protein